MATDFFTVEGCPDDSSLRGWFESESVDLTCSDCNILILLAPLILGSCRGVRDVGSPPSFMGLAVSESESWRVSA